MSLQTSSSKWWLGEIKTKKILVDTLHCNVSLRGFLVHIEAENNSPAIRTGRRSPWDDYFEPRFISVSIDDSVIGYTGRFIDIGHRA